MNTKRWTCEEDARLMVRHRKGRSPGSIAREFRRSEGAIKSRLAKHLFHIEHGKKCGYPPGLVDGITEILSPYMLPGMPHNKIVDVINLVLSGGFDD